jgi:hypothetical protein
MRYMIAKVGSIAFIFVAPTTSMARDRPATPNREKVHACGDALSQSPHLFVTLSNTASEPVPFDAEMTINSVAQPVGVLKGVVTGGIPKISCVNSIPLVGKIEAKSFNCSRITGKRETPTLSRIIESHQCELYESLRGGSSSPTSRGTSPTVAEPLSAFYNGVDRTHTEHATPWFGLIYQILGVRFREPLPHCNDLRKNTCCGT